MTRVPAIISVHKVGEEISATISAAGIQPRHLPEAGLNEAGLRRTL